MLQHIPHYTLEFLIVSFVVLLTIIAILSGEQIPSLLPVLGVFGVASIRLVSISSRLVTELFLIKRNQFATQRLWEDLRYLSAIEQEQILPSDCIQLPTSSSFHSLTLQNVSFRYETAKDFALQQITLAINRGDSIGIIGKSGAGKTTLIDVLLGLLKPQSGTISHNAKELDNENWKKWMTQVAYIPQEIFLIDDSLKRNIALGVSDERFSEEKLRNAIRQARLEELLQNLPQNVDTMIGDRGIRLSGGQRQRVALARAFYFQRKVLIMDEATSALDDETENEIINEIQELTGTVTLIIIAHRLTTIRYCKKIYRLDAGKIIEEGSFEDVVGEV
jgi:ABC-type bacteriocin/lantibiotic exporter with double-glycine peptidase domain